jgi:hypothetical protein
MAGLNGNGQASAKHHEPAPASTDSTATTEQPKSHGVDGAAGFNGNANASAKRDSTQPAGRKVDASGSADANASAQRR